MQQAVINPSLLALALAYEVEIRCRVKVSRGNPGLVATVYGEPGPVPPTQYTLVVRTIEGFTGVCDQNIAVGFSHTHDRFHLVTARVLLEKSEVSFQCIAVVKEPTPLFTRPDAISDRAYLRIIIA